MQMPVSKVLLLLLTKFMESLQQNYTILTEADIRQRQDDDTARISTVLSIPKPQASILLRYYNWWNSVAVWMH